MLWILSKKVLNFHPATSFKKSHLLNTKIQQLHHNVEGEFWERKIPATVKWQFPLTCLNRRGSKMMQHKQREPTTNRGWKSRHHRERHSPAPEWGAEAPPPAAPSTPESRVSLATPSLGLLLRVAGTSGWRHRLFALKSTRQKEVRWIRFRHIYFFGGRQAHRRSRGWSPPEFAVQQRGRAQLLPPTFSCPHQKAVVVLETHRRLKRRWWWKCSAMSLKQAGGPSWTRDN